MFNLDLDLSNVEADDFSAIPDGSYTLQIEEAIVKNTKAGNGAYIECKSKVVSETQNGRYVWTRYNVQNPNPKAVEIGLRQLKTLILAAGSDATKISDPSQLIGLTFEGYLVSQDNEWGTSTDVKKIGKAGVELKYMPRQKPVKVTPPAVGTTKPEDVPF